MYNYLRRKRKTLRELQEKYIPLYLETPPRENPLTRLNGNNDDHLKTKTK